MSFIFFNRNDIVDVGVDVWVFILADFGKATCSSLLAVLANFSGNSVWWKKTYPIIKVTIRSLYVQYGHCKAKQTYKNVSNGIVEFTEGL